MNQQQHDWDELEYRVGCGDSEARAVWQQEMQPRLECIVRTTARNGPGKNPVSKWAHAAACEVVKEQRGAKNVTLEDLMDQVVQRMCDSLAARLTAAAASRQAALDTVSNF